MTFFAPFASLRDALFLARHEVRYMLGRRETLMWTFAMPIVFFYFIGTITGGLARGGGDAKDPIAVRVPVDGGFLADQLIRRLEDRGYRIVRASEQDFPRYGRRLTLPAGFTAAVLAHRPVHVQFERKGAGLGSNYDEIRISRAVYSVLADLIVLAEKNTDASPEAFARLAAAPRPLTMEVERAGERKKIPSGFEQAVPGTMVNFILLVLFTTGGVLIVNERNLGLLRRLASAPISRGAIVLGKWMARMTLGMIQIAFGMITGTVLFHVDWGHHLPTLIAVLLCYGALGAALGMVLGNVARTDAQVIGFGVIATNVMAALGGCWWPIEVTPDWAQKLAIVFPTGWAMDALHRLVSFGYGPASVLPHMAGMLAAALIAAFIAARTFRFQ